MGLRTADRGSVLTLYVHLKPTWVGHVPTTVNRCGEEVSVMSQQSTRSVYTNTHTHTHKHTRNYRIAGFSSSVQAGHHSSNSIATHYWVGYQGQIKQDQFK